MHINKDVSAGVVIGMLLPFAAIFGIAGLAWVWRRIKMVVLYAKPAYLTRRITVAAAFVGGRRAYVFGGHFLRLAIIVGRRGAVEQQARAVLFKEFIPQPERAE